jgi:hypothetical protein
MGCTSESNFHPIPEKFPYITSDASEIKVRRVFTNRQEEVIVPGASLLDKSPAKAQLNFGIPVDVDEPLVDLNFVKLASTESAKVLLVDLIGNRLYQLNFSDGKWIQIAGPGRGPGELMFSADLVTHNGMAYVVTKDSRIIRFDCMVGDLCEYAEVVNLENLNPGSVLISDDGFTVMGLRSEHSMPSENMEANINTLFRTNTEGELLSTFGELYNTDGEWMLIQPFEAGGIRPGLQSGFVQYYELLPKLYLFDNSETEPHTIYELSGFNLSKREYDSNNRELFVNFDDWSRILTVESPEEGKLIVIIQHFLNREVVDSRAQWDQMKDIYVIDLNKQSANYIGPFNPENENLVFSNSHILRSSENGYQLIQYSIK